MSVVSTAYEYLGIPYVWGGATPSGFDCSGLVQYSFAQNGVTVPRTSQEQFAYTANSRITNQADLKAGDLVFFKGYTNSATNPGHVGIYIGNNQFIEAPKSGDVVKVSSLSSRSDFVGGGRVVTSNSDNIHYDEAIGPKQPTTTTGATTTTTGAEDTELNWIGRIFGVVVLVFLAVLCVLFFTKAFDSPVKINN